MSDGHVMVISADPDNTTNRDAESTRTSSGVHILYSTHFKECGGIWTICTVKKETQLALGCVNGLFFCTIEPKDLTRTQE